MVQQCHICSNIIYPGKEIVLGTTLPEYPWQKVGTDLFELRGVHSLSLGGRLYREITGGSRIGIKNIKCSHHGIEVSLLSSGHGGIEGSFSQVAMVALKAAFSQHRIPA